IKKSLGQNFLIDVNILSRIIDSAGIDSNSNVIEIGPGIGSLTEQLALKANKVVAFEIDERLKPVLESTLSPYDNIKVLLEDILDADIQNVIEREFTPGESIHIVVYISYFIYTTLLLSILIYYLIFNIYTVI